jgi:hypothetical protein
VCLGHVSGFSNFPTSHHCSLKVSECTDNSVVSALPSVKVNMTVTCCEEYPSGRKSELPGLNSSKIMLTRFVGIDTKEEERNPV